MPNWTHPLPQRCSADHFRCWAPTSSPECAVQLKMVLMVQLVVKALLHPSSNSVFWLYIRSSCWLPFLGARSQNEVGLSIEPRPRPPGQGANMTGLASHLDFESQLNERLTMPLRTVEGPRMRSIPSIPPVTPICEEAIPLKHGGGEFYFFFFSAGQDPISGEIHTIRVRVPHILREHFAS